MSRTPACLEVVRPWLQNDHSQRRSQVNALLNAEKAVATWVKRILPDSSATIQAVLDDPHSMAALQKVGFKDG